MAFLSSHKNILTKNWCLNKSNISQVFPVLFILEIKELLNELGWKF